MIPNLHRGHGETWAQWAIRTCENCRCMEKELEDYENFEKARDAIMREFPEIFEGT